MINISLGLSDIPLYEQIYAHIKGEIESRTLTHNCKLPSVRKLASSLGVSVNTIDSAYQQLVAEGYIEPVAHTGYFVCELEEFMYVSNPPLDSELPSNHDTDYIIDFSPYAVSTEHFPKNNWRKIFKNCLLDDSIFITTQNRGDTGLRTEISKYLYESRGVSCSYDQIILGTGSEYLLQILSLMLDKKMPVAMENPVYNRAYRIFENMDYTVFPIDIDERGISMSVLLDKNIPYVYVTPSHQFPLGISMPISRRITLLNYINEMENGYIIEDDYDSEFRYHAKPLPSLKSIDTEGKVIYIGTFSKSVSPTVRISYMVLPQNLLSTYEEKAGFMSCPIPTLNQQVLAEFMRGGYFERHLNRMRNIYKGKRELLIKELMSFGNSIDVMGENAGHHLLLKLNSKLSEKEMVSLAKNSGIKVYGISEYFLGEVPKKYASTVLLGYAGLTDEQLSEGISLLKKAWQ